MSSSSLRRSTMRARGVSPSPVHPPTPDRTPTPLRHRDRSSSCCRTLVRAGNSVSCESLLQTDATHETRISGVVADIVHKRIDLHTCQAVVAHFERLFEPGESFISFPESS